MLIKRATERNPYQTNVMRIIASLLEQHKRQIKDGVTTWCWPSLSQTFVWEIHRSPVESPGTKGQQYVHNLGVCSLFVWNGSWTNSHIRHINGHMGYCKDFVVYAVYDKMI